MAHIHEKIDFTVACLIVNRHIEIHTNVLKVLLCFHTKAQQWLPIGGHVELDEDTDTALFREIKEETGLTVTILDSEGHSSYVQRWMEDTNGDRKPLLRPHTMDMHKFNDPKCPNHYHIGLMYIGETEDNKLNPDPGETNKLQWFRYDELDSLEPMDTFIRIQAKNALLSYM